MSTFIEQIGDVPPVFDADRASAAMDDLLVAESSSADNLRELVDENEHVRDLLKSVFGASPYLTRIALQSRDMLLACLSQAPDAFLDKAEADLNDALGPDASRASVMDALRIYKQSIALAIGLYDVSGVWTIDQVTQVLSRTACVTISATLDFLLRQAIGSGKFRGLDTAHPQKGCGYFVLGMGKLGAGELNYSSDIDLIVFYDAAIAPMGEGQEPAPFFVRLTRDLATMLQERTAQGYVWRTDLRLRPDPGATQLALSTDAGLSYYESFGQNWERAAMIKARVVAGDHSAGEAFLEQLKPFVWRRYLDFAAVADIHAMKRRVHEFKGHGKIAVAGHDVKLGRGGIREIEFFTQTQQLIAGGRQPDLRIPQTLKALQRLSDQGWIESSVVQRLTDAYRFLRMVEHRIQMVGDEQTHSLPKDDAELERIACFCGFENADEFSKTLIEYLTAVQGDYDMLFAKLPKIGDDEDVQGVRPDDELPEVSAALNEAGFKDPDKIIEMIRSWRAGRYAATRSERARQSLNVIQPNLLTAIAHTADPDGAMNSFDRFLSELPAGVQLFALLRSNPGLLQLIATIMGTAPRLAQFLSRRSQVLDAVLDPGFFGDLPRREEIDALVSADLSQISDFQDLLENARRIGQEQAFLIGVRLLSGAIDSEQAGSAYAALADTLLRNLHDGVSDELVRQHGELAGAEAAVIAMGKLGGGEMTAASDLDLIIVYDFDPDTASSDGQRPLSGGQYFARFTQRLISAISAQTAQGCLYEVDMRLRPSGNSGPVATQFDGFVDYQRNNAWTWEHLALSRARVVTGPPAFVEKLEKAIKEVLTDKRDRKIVAEDVRDMRERIAREKGNQDIWDLKIAAGGLVDVEFITQFLQITHAHEHPEILTQNTISGLKNLSAAGLLKESDAELLIRAAQLYHNLTQVLRLCLERPFDRENAAPGLQELLARAGGAADFVEVEARLRATLSEVEDCFDRLVR